MAEVPQQRSLQSGWQAMPATQKALLVLLLIAVAAGIYFLFNWARTANYAPLFTGLDPKEAGTITESLKEMKVPYRLTNQGTAIEVPKSQVYETRIQLATSGAVGGDGPGFELFDNTRFGVTEFEQKVDYQRALQGELQRTIAQLGEVEQARVHLVIPEKSVFNDEEAETKASVVVKLKPGAALSQSQVRGVVALVSGSVEGLQPENVHLVDTSGRVLNGETAGDGLTGAALAQHEAARAFELACEKKVQSVLQPILGAEKYVVQVTAELDFDRQETVSSLPTEQSTLVTEHTVRETSSGGQASGVPETEESLTGVPTYTAGDGSGSFQREETDRAYQVGSIQETTVKAPGNVRRLSAAVVLDTSAATGQQEQIQQVVTAALGLDTERGDQVVVSAMAFEPGIEEEMPPEPAPEPAQNQWLLYVAIGGAVLLLLIIVFVVISMRRGRKATARAPQPVVQDVAPVAVRQVDPAFQAPAGKDPTPVRELAKQKPDQVAEIIKVWLTTEGQGR